MGVISKSRLLAVSLFAALSCAGTAVAQEQIVYIDGTKYTIHTVVRGETLYSLAKGAGVTVEALAAHNPSAKDGLKEGQRLKIPYVDKMEKGEKFSKKRFDTHIVKRGETLYSISRRYSISLNALIADNGNLNPSQLAVGQTLHIRKSEVGQTDAVEAERELQLRSEAMNSVAGGDYSYHVVHRGETAADIAERFGTTEQELLRLNRFSGVGAVREGSIIKVPKLGSGSGVVEDGPSLGDSCRTALQPVAVEFRRLAPSDRAKVSLLLPLSVNGSPAVNYIDFYQGFLLGVDDVRKQGYSINVRLHNTAHDHLRIGEMVERGEFDHADLIVGPVYEDEQMAMARFAEERSIPIVSPLAAIGSVSSAAAFQMSPDMGGKFDKVRELFDGSRRVVMITTESIDAEFDAEVRELLGDTPYETHLYQYEHPSVLAERKEDDPPSPGDLSPLLQSEDERETLFLVMADNETDVDRILAALASANISLTARSQSVVPYRVFGNTRWNRYRNIDRAILFADNVVMLSSYHARRDNGRVRDFDGRYTKAFGSIPSLYSYRGYDAAMIFIKALYDGIGNLSDGRTFMPLQTPYRFKAEEGRATNVNGEWVRVDYNRNFTITTK